MRSNGGLTYVIQATLAKYRHHQEAGIVLGRPDKPLISRERAARAALDVIDTQGLNALSLELVARQLGVKAPSLYYHFKHKNELLSEVALCILRDIKAPFVDVERWQETLVGLCLATRRTILLHPNAAPLLLEFFPKHIFLKAYDFWTAICPYPEDMQLLILEGCEKLTFGSALFASASRSRAIAPMPDFDRAEFPALAKAVRANPFDEEALFVETLKTFLAGVQAQAEASAKPASAKAR